MTGKQLGALGFVSPEPLQVLRDVQQELCTDSRKGRAGGGGLVAAEGRGTPGLHKRKRISSKSHPLSSGTPTARMDGTTGFSQREGSRGFILDQY